jgi:hypothetical protein
MRYILFYFIFAPEPKITGVDSNTIGYLLFAVYEKELTISEAIKQLQRRK